MDFEFRYLQDERELVQLESFLRLHSLGYPNYQDWVTRTREEVNNSYKNAILAFSDRTIVGDLIFQPHKQFPKHMMEIKNLRVDWRTKGMGLAEFMIKQVEVESRRKGYHAIVGDTRSDNTPVIRLVTSCGFRELARTHLYESDKQDVVYFKPLKKASVFRRV